MSLKVDIKNRMMEIAPLGVVNDYYVRRNSRRLYSWRSAPFFLIHIPKSAGMSISATVGLPDPGHITFQQMKATLAQNLADKPCFAVVRDPYERIISTFVYAHKLRDMGVVNSLKFIADCTDINQFVQEIMVSYQKHYFLRPAWDFISSAREFGASVTVADFSCIERDWSNFKERHKIDTGILENINKSKIKNNLRIDLDKESKICIDRLYSIDFNLIEDKCYT